MALLALAKWYVSLGPRVIPGPRLTSIRMQGYQMAKNLQSKLSPADSVRLFDINKDAMYKLAEDMRASQAGGAVVELAENVAEAAKEAVSSLP